MNKDAAIDLLRYALASIWTECENNLDDGSCLNKAYNIIDSALGLTVEYAKPKDLTKDGISLEGWNKYVEKYMLDKFSVKKKWW